jgi:hypothetical protein
MLLQPLDHSNVRQAESATTFQHETYFGLASDIESVLRKAQR